MITSEEAMERIRSACARMLHRAADMIEAKERKAERSQPPEAPKELAMSDGGGIVCPSCEAEMPIGGTCPACGYRDAR